METWRPVPGWPRYEVSDLGNVRSLPRVGPGPGPRRGMLLRRVKSHYGYLAVNLYRDGEARTKRIHELVMLAFVGPRPAGQEVCHKNGDPGDPRLENLEYKTHKENGQDMMRHGRSPRGERQGSSKLTAAEVRAIKRMSSVFHPRHVAWTFAVSEATIRDIKAGRTWAHV